MAMEHLSAESNAADTKPLDDTKPTTWAAKWDMWWMRTAAFGWMVLLLVILLKLERSIWTSSLELKLVIAAPLFIGGLTAFEAWKARRDGRIQNKLADSVFWSFLFILWFVYFGMVELVHLPH
jgi:hypothetical protein